MPNLFSFRPKSMQKPLFDTEKSNRIKELHSKIYSRTRSKNDILTSMGMNLRKDLEFAQKLKESDDKIRNPVVSLKSWKPSVLAETVQLNLDLDQLPLLPKDMKK